MFDNNAAALVQAIHTTGCPHHCLQHLHSKSAGGQRKKEPRIERKLKKKRNERKGAGHLPYRGLPPVDFHLDRNSFIGIYTREEEEALFTALGVVSGLYMQ